jgi:small nuclear ribonucleoprotein (snRNP)-like protein
MYSFKLFLAVIFLLVSLEGIFAQDSEITIKLKNGSIIKGMVMEEDQNGNFTLLINDQELKINHQDILTISSNEKHSIKPAKVIFNRTSISYFNGSIGNGYSLQHSLYYRITDYIYSGIGLGISNFVGEEGNNLFPVFVDVEADLKKGTASPFLAISAGYAFAVTNQELGQLDADGGLLFAPRVGYRFFPEEVMIDIYAGFRFQKAKYLYRDWNIEAEDDLHYRRLEIGLGIKF